MQHPSYGCSTPAWKPCLVPTPTLNYPPPPELDRPDQKPEAILGLPGILARATGRDIEQIYAGSNKGVLADVDMLQRITEASRACVREFVRDRTGGRGGGEGDTKGSSAPWARAARVAPCGQRRWAAPAQRPLLTPHSPPPHKGLDGRIGTNFLTTIVKFTGLYVDPWVRALQGGEFSSADRLQLVTLFKYLEFCLEQVRTREARARATRAPPAAGGGPRSAPPPHGS
jgi:magnesium chelatase subunit H